MFWLSSRSFLALLMLLSNLNVVAVVSMLLADWFFLDFTKEADISASKSASSSESNSSSETLAILLRLVLLPSCFSFATKDICSLLAADTEGSSSRMSPLLSVSKLMTLSILL
ncbi:hypothetical protein WICPIJ_002629 [Wickerhamomyces pijperi]|uniref:Uncharacterized protein n=1 Tax=Wickerhamomyces pijperi TaxID=599730 RepID=A0A9P8TPQ1_WICPI|nr:hypothetical protein WICPIJ_002629 [Wickerhamomyces pijperi]